MKLHLKKLALATGIAIAANFAQASISTVPLDKDFTLQLLGSGGPITDDQRASSGEVIWWKGKSQIMIDAGSGVFLRFGQSSARMEDLDFLGITHFHTDHVSDLAGLLKGAIFFNRDNPLYMAGPTGNDVFPSLTNYMKASFNGKDGAYAYMNGIFDGTDGFFPVKLTDVNISDKSKTTKVYEKDGLTIWAHSIPHGDVPTVAYRIESDKGTMVISADQNGSNDSFIDFAKDADLLVMPLAIDEEADSTSAFMHAKPSTVGKIAAKTNAKMLVLNHLMGRSLVKKEDSVKIIKQYYKGPVYVGRDLASYTLNPDNA